MNAPAGTLYLVGTPIGNLEDLSPRAGRILGEVAGILAEDTRRTRVLTRHLGISTPLLSLYAENEAARTGEILARLSAGASLALVSDAGMPLVSDPGERLVRRVLEAGHDVVPVPGPSALLAALVASGLPVLPCAFLGFTPRRGKRRTGFLERIRRSEETVVLFESPRRLAGLLRDLCALGESERPAAVAREMTKLHEEYRRGTVGSLARYYAGEERIRGEVTVVIGPARGGGTLPGEGAGDARRVARALLNAGVPASRAAGELAARLGIRRNRAYRIVLEEASDPDIRREDGT